MITLKKFKIVLFLLLIVGCAPIRKYADSDYKKINDISKIEGQYENYSVNSENKNYNSFYGIINWRKKQSDSTKFSTVNVKVLNKKLLRFSFTNSTGNKKDINVKYKIVENGFVALKNRNFKLTGLPYIFGGYQINKVELGLTNQNQLILNGTKIDEGAILIIMPASMPKTNYTCKFERN